MVWREVAAMSQARSGHTATTLLDGRVLVLGGFANETTLASAEIFDPLTDTWSAAAPMNHARDGHVAIRLLDGRVFVTGGGYVDPFPYGKTLRTSEIYDPRTNTWTAAASASGSAYGSVAQLPDGRVLVHLILEVDGQNAGILTAYDPAANTWKRIARTPSPRIGPSLTVLADGSILVAGGDSHFGEGESAGTPDAWRFAPATGTWTELPPMGTATLLNTATLLGDGRVLMAGGLEPDLFDPATNSWSRTRPARAFRDFNAAVTLLDGRVLLVGTLGCASGNDDKVAEIYDPATNAWSKAGWVPYEGQVAAALLGTGRVLVSGGSTSCPVGDWLDDGAVADTFVLDLADLH